VLQHNVQQYEQTFGEIKLDPAGPAAPPSSSMKKTPAGKPQ